MKKALLSFAILVLLVAEATAQTYTDLYDFDGIHGANPGYPDLLAQGHDGDLYATTPTDGIHNDGEAFKVTPGGDLTVLYNGGSYGVIPDGGLTLGLGGRFYGTASFGGLHNLGTVFRFVPGGSAEVLYSFTGGQGGGEPFAPPIRGTSGSFYGTTAFGGTAIAYRITSGGTFSVLGMLPGASTAPLLEGRDSNFYGTTVGGGDFTCNPSNGCGTIFEITPSGLISVPHTFGGADGEYPTAPLIQDDEGNLYGTTDQGGTYGEGVVFQLTAQGVYAVLHEFGDPNDPNDGGSPIAGLVQGSDGNLFGATSSGGTSGFGTVFQIAPAGNYSVLHNLDGTDGAVPSSTPVQHTNGKIYGMASEGGTSNLGIIYVLDLGLPPFIRPVCTSGRVGQTGGILGQGFTGTTSVSINGVPAAFTVVSDTYLTATVPVGATTGFITVVTPSGTLTSNQKFQVRP